MTDEPVVPVPADLEFEERLVGPVTFRMASWLAASAAGAVLLGVGGPTAGRLAVGVPLLVVGLVGALWRPGGRAAPSWLRPMTGYLRRHRADRVVAPRPDVMDSDVRVDVHDPQQPEPVAPHRPRFRFPGTAQIRARVLRPPAGRTRRPLAVAAAVLLIVGAFAGGRLVRAHHLEPAPAQPAPPVSATPAPAPPTPLDPWSDCGC